MSAIYAAIAVIAVIDAVRLHWRALSSLGYLNVAGWLTPGTFGIACRRRLLTGRATLGTAVSLLAVNVALIHWGPYELSMVGTATTHGCGGGPRSATPAR